VLGREMRLPAKQQKVARPQLGHRLLAAMPPRRREK
jgi:hypothetical protein